MRYDTTLKEILQAGAPRLWELLLGEQPREFLTVELPSVKMRKPDFVVWLESGALAHLEIQGDNDGEMEWRELEYYQYLNRLFGVPPIQIVLYIGSEPLRMRQTITHANLHFRYTIIDIRNYNSEAFLSGLSLNDQALALLADGTPRQSVVQLIMDNLKVLPTQEQRDWLERLMILAGLRGAESMVAEEAKKMGISLDIRDNKFFQEAYHYGRVDACRDVVRELLVTRFGALPEWAQQKLSELDEQTLANSSKRVLTVAALDEFFAEPLVN